MRRHSNNDNPDSSAAQWHPRKHSPGAERLLPTTLAAQHSSSNNHACTNKDATSKRNLRKRRLDRTSTTLISRICPSLLVHKNGVLTLNSNVIQYFAVAAALLLLAVHLFLFRQLSSAQEEQHNLVSPVLSVNNTTQQQEQPSPRILTPLRPIDKEQFTIRINTWQRLDQLLVSIDHHASCPGVAQIQVVWCEPIDPPASLMELHPDKVVVERHTVNSLNERFHILPTTDTPTLGILSMDDDVLRPCEAIDSGFVQWTQSPARFVGFDYRIHVTQDDGSWKVCTMVYSL